MVKALTSRSILCLWVLWVCCGADVTAAEPVTVTWEDLRADRPDECSTFLKNYLTERKCAQQTASARLFSRRYASCAPGKRALDGKRIKIAGYVHPLEFKFQDVKTFLLIPALRNDCRHPPPPLPDQVILVEYLNGVNVTADPVWVTGTIRLKYGKTHLSATSYVLTGLFVEPAQIPDVSNGG